MAEILQDLMLEHFKRIHTDLSDLKQMRTEMREGFASMRQHFLAQQGDISLIDLEDKVGRINQRLDLSESPEA